LLRLEWHNSATLLVYIVSFAFWLTTGGCQYGTRYLMPRNFQRGLLIPNISLYFTSPPGIQNLNFEDEALLASGFVVR